jgi:hypothetical protein
VKTIISLIIVFSVVFYGAGAFGAEKIVFDFEGSNDAWEVPDWAFYQSDHKARTAEASDDVASSGKGSLKVMCEFPGDVWTAAVVEVKKDIDLREYETISVDVYLPKKAPRDIMQARIILTVGDGWRFTEMREGIPLERGKWTTIKVQIDKGAEEGSHPDWKGRGEKRLYHDIDKVRKIAVRIEYNAAPPHRLGPRYYGPVYVDNVVIE